MQEVKEKEIDFRKVKLIDTCSTVVNRTITYTSTIKRHFLCHNTRRKLSLTSCKVLSICDGS